MVTAAFTQPAAALEPLRWSFFFDEDAYGCPCLKVHVRFYDDNDQPYYRDLKVDYDDKTLYLEQPGRRSQQPNPTVDDVDALKADLERHFEGTETLYERDSVKAVRS